MFSKRVKIFGRSVPLAAILAAVVTVVAAAAWLIIALTANVQVTSSSFGPFAVGIPLRLTSGDYSLNECSYTENPPGSGTWDVNWANAIPGRYCGIDVPVTNNGPVPGYASFVEVSSNPALAPVLECGTEITPGATENISFTYSLDETNSDPGQVYNGVVAELQIVHEAPACP